MSSAPLFILSPPRSFSSIACGMIGQHPQMIGLPELNLFLADTVGETAFFMKQRMPHGQDGLLRAIAELHLGGQDKQRIDEAKAFVARRLSWGTDRMVREIMSACTPRRIVEKSPSTVMRRGAIARLRAYVADASFLHLSRHPISFGRSLLSFAKQSADWGRAIGSSRIDLERIWYQAHLSILHFCVSLPEGTCLHVRGEDLLSQPARALAQIAQWLGVRDDPQAVESMLHPEHSPFACPGPPNAQGGGDPGFLNDPALRPFTPPDVSLGERTLWSGEVLGPETVRLALLLGYR